jgi:hypothetical protein
MNKTTHIKAYYLPNLIKNIIILMFKIIKDNNNNKLKILLKLI